jgi:hypothetical protein
LIIDPASKSLTQIYVLKYEGWGEYDGGADIIELEDRECELRAVGSRSSEKDGMSENSDRGGSCRTGG